MTMSKKLTQTTRLIIPACLLVSVIAASAAGPWKLMGSTDKGMDVIDSFASQAECTKALAALMQRPTQRDFMCTDGSKPAAAPIK